MIKLIATDLDGTLLLHGAQNVSRHALNLIAALHEKNILFVAASGRQYPNLLRLFQDVGKYMAFICENGALVMQGGNVLKKSCMKPELAFSLIDDIHAKAGCEVLISGQNTSYIMPKSEAYAHRMIHIVKNNVQIVDDFKKIPEDIIKISVYEEAGIAEHSASNFIKKWENEVACTISGFAWLDFVNPDVNKGEALAALLHSLNISPKETAAFGDNYNDLEMLSLVEYGYVMEHAHNDIKSKYSLRTTLVEDTLEELLNGI